VKVAKLPGLHRWLTVPSTVSGILGALLAIAYAFFTVQIPEGTLVQLLLCIAVWVALANVLGDRQEQGSLRTVRALATSSVERSVPVLQAAVREAAALPDLSFQVNLGYWCAGAGLIGLSYWLVPGVPWTIALRFAVIGVGLGPLVAMLAYLLEIERARAAVVVLAKEGLSVAQVLQALPPTRMSLRARMVVYGAIAIGTPLFLVFDMAVQRAERTFAALAVATSQAQRSSVLAADLRQALIGFAVVGGAVAVVVVTCSLLSGRALGEPMRELAAQAQRLTLGKIGQKTVVPAEDEVWAAGAGFLALEGQLAVVVTQLQAAGGQVKLATSELVASSARHEHGAQEQTLALAQTSATTEELARSAKQIAANANQVSALALQTVEASQEGQHSSEAFYRSILAVRGGNQAIADSVVKLNKRVQQVGRVVEFIDGIADKADLLALNAELEGHKAGEVGQGFSLVAAEMRRLAESVMESTREIGRLIEDIRDATNAAVMATEAGVKASDQGSALAQAVSEGLGNILKLSRTTSEAVRAISLATHQQQVGTDQLAQAMGDILASTRAGSAAQAEMQGANASLKGLADELERAVGQFEVVS